MRKSIPVLSILSALTLIFAASPALARRRRRSHNRARHGNSYGHAPRNLNEGLCTSANSNSTEVKKGYCQEIYQELTDPNGCSKKLLDKLAAGHVKGMDEFCPGYTSLADDSTQRALFYENFLAAMAYQESSWNPTETGDHGHSIGIFQISVSDKHYGCGCSGLNSSNIRNAKKNIKCGVYIALKNMSRDMQVAADGPGKANIKGVARYFGPFRYGRPERKYISSKTSNYCQARVNSPNSPSSPGVADQPGQEFVQNIPLPTENPTRQPSSVGTYSLYGEAVQ